MKTTKLTNKNLINMDTVNHQHDHLITIKMKQGKIIDLDMYPAELCEKYEWVKDPQYNNGGYIADINDSSRIPIITCSKSDFEEMDGSGIWSIDNDGVITENLPLKDLTDEQFFELWRKYPSQKWELLQAAANLTPERVEMLKEHHRTNKYVRCAIEEGVTAISAVGHTFGGNFLDEVDELIAEQEQEQENK